MNKTPLKAGPYTIPSGHMLLPCGYEIFMGEKSWRDPEKFDPTRFLVAGKFKRDERVLPFQVGKRVCPGTNCIKIGLPGKLILSKRKGLREVLFSWK